MANSFRATTRPWAVGCSFFIHLAFIPRLVVSSPRSLLCRFSFRAFAQTVSTQPAPPNSFVIYLRFSPSFLFCLSVYCLASFLSPSPSVNLVWCTQARTGLATAGPRHPRAALCLGTSTIYAHHHHHHHHPPPPPPPPPPTVPRPRVNGRCARNPTPNLARLPNVILVSSLIPVRYSPFFWP
ncbi:hypothetical protein C8Q80DRAFT_498648 [Daedaleopsis nitida]|nr:hypothetical protein C8Q80DRAFT_498648 [Daedaleopsis nitida]